MTIGYQTFGTGPHRVIALHGWFGNQTTYDPMWDALSPEEFTYVFPAYRGYGLSRRLTGEYSIAEIASDVIELADHLRFERFSLIGHSMGGKAIQRILADAPDRVRRLVAITPVPASGVPFDDDTKAAFRSAVNNPDVRRGIVSFSVGGRPLSKTWLDRTAGVPRLPGNPDAFAGYFESWAIGDFSEEIRGKPTPVKVIVGEFDGALTPELMQATYLAWYPNAELEVMKNAGHYPMDETPVALASSIEAFLRQD
jgi:pimeloyl-ACP methyl ester carboxylesterase